MGSLGATAPQHSSISHLTHLWRRNGTIFQEIWQSSDIKKAKVSDIEAAAIRLKAVIYCCETNLNWDGPQIFMNLCNDKKRRRKIILDRLPPTADAVELYVQRSYLQIQEWNAKSLRLESYGWKKVDGVLEPISMGQKHAPRFLMEVKKCGCTSGCKSWICRCVTDGLACNDKCSCGNTYENPKNSENNDVVEEKVCDDSYSASSDERVLPAFFILLKLYLYCRL